MPDIAVAVGCFDVLCSTHQHPTVAIWALPVRLFATVPQEERTAASAAELHATFIFWRVVLMYYARRTSILL